MAFGIWKALVLVLLIALGVVALQGALSAARAPHDTPGWGRSPNMMFPSAPPGRFTV